MTIARSTLLRRVVFASILSLAIVAMASRTKQPSVTQGTEGEEPPPTRRIEATHVAESTLATVALRIAVTDERSAKQGAPPLIWTRGEGSWYPSFSGGGDVKDISGFRRGSDTILIFAKGRDRPPAVVPLQVTSAICPDACVQHMTMVLLKDREIRVSGAAVPNSEIVYRTDRPGALSHPPGERVARAELKEAWPLTVSEGWLDCVAGNRIVFRTTRESYGVNGTASTHGYANIESIWRKNPSIPGTRVNIGPLLERGREICKRAPQ